MRFPEHDPALPVVCVDFDGMLAKSTWPSPHIGEPDLDALELIGHYYRLGCEVIILTARPQSHFGRIWDWLFDLGVDDVIYDITNQKPVACLYFDDRAVRWPL